MKKMKILQKNIGIVDINTRVNLHSKSRFCGHEEFSAVATAAAVTALPRRTAAGGTV